MDRGKTYHGVTKGRRVLHGPSRHSPPQLLTRRATRMQTLDRALIAVGAATAILLVMTIIATAGERHQTLEEVNQEINRYWQQWREEFDRRSDLQLQQQQADSLRQIESNTAKEAQ